MKLSGFADEALASFGGQLALLARLGIGHLELRRLGTTPVLSASERQLRQAERALTASGIGVSCLASDLGKVPVGVPLPREAERLRRAAAFAHRFGTPYVRVFSFRTTRPEFDRSEVLHRLEALAHVAAREAVTLLHENERGTWGDSPARCAEIAALAPGHLRLILDPANFVQCGWRPYDEAWPLLGAATAHVHVKDAVASTGRVVVAGAGDAQWPELLKALDARRYPGFLALEPHLGLGGRGGPVRPRRWGHAASALRHLLTGDLTPTT